MSIPQAVLDAMAAAKQAKLKPAPAPAPAPAPVTTAASVAEEVTHDSLPVAKAYQRPVAKVKTLADKAVLVHLKRRAYSPYRKDADETEQYGAGNVNKHLFQGKNRVRTALAAYNEVYTYVTGYTLPWLNGIYLLNMNIYVDFTKRFNELKDAADDAVKDLCDNWNYEVQEDMKRLAAIGAAKGKPNLVNPDDYPTEFEMRQRWGIELRFAPVPDSGDFRVAISESDKDSLQSQLDDAEANAARHVITQMMEPMARAVEKLAIPIGTDKSVFRDSLVDNMLETCERMASINLSDDPVLEDRIDEMRSLVGAYAGNKDVLRNSGAVRAKAVDQISDLMEKMKGMA